MYLTVIRLLPYGDEAEDSDAFKEYVYKYNTSSKWYTRTMYFNEFRIRNIPLLDEGGTCGGGCLLGVSIYDFKIENRFTGITFGSYQILRKHAFDAFYHCSSKLTV